MSEISVKFLGSGTSHGVPMIACDCETCTSTDIKDKRTNASVLISFDGNNILIDCGKDFRNQAIQHKIMNISAVFITHNHSDHTSGIDDLRAFNRVQEGSIPVFGNKDHLEEIKNYTFRYLFSEETQKGGGIANITLNPIDQVTRVEGMDIEPLNVTHGGIDIFGYKFKNCAYITDVSFIPDETIEKLQGLDILIIDALRFDKHPTHFNVRQALQLAEQIKPKKTYFTHICHDIMHSK
ncbi:MAG: MBL fold metallo-hydrolase, partial [Psychromonas sp.]